MARLTAIVATLVLSLGVPHTAVGAVGSSDYSEAVKSTIADNQNQDNGNVTLMRNIMCTFLPFDAAGYPPTFHAAGSGVLEVSASPAILKGSDRASFDAICYSPSFRRSFTLDVTYRFQSYVGRGKWVDLGSQFRCSAGSSAVGDQRLAYVQIPGTDNCPFETVYQEGDPSLSRPHRLQVELTVSADDGTQGPQIKGWSVPWQMAAVVASGKR